MLACTYAYLEAYFLIAAGSEVVESNTLGNEVIADVGGLGQLHD